MATARLADHIENLRAKPEHVRRRIALGASGGITGIVVVVWAVALATSGSFALTSGTLASGEPAPNIKNAFSETGSSFSNLLGAAGAALGATSTPPSLNIVETNTSSTLDTGAADTNATVIPF